jgi:hypothetical protein
MAQTGNIISRSILTSADPCSVCRARDLGAEWTAGPSGVPAALGPC